MPLELITGHTLSAIIVTKFWDTEKETVALDARCPYCGKTYMPLRADKPYVRCDGCRHVFKVEVL